MSGYTGPTASLDTLVLVMEREWEENVRHRLTELKEILRPDLICDGLYAQHLLSKPEWEQMRRNFPSTKEEKTADLLVTILPTKGPNSFSRFLSVLRETDGQEHIADMLCSKAR